LHVDEFVDSSGAEFAVKIGAISADHLMSVSQDGIKALSKSDTVATILPGTTFFLNSDKYANGRKMIDEGCTVSLASDFNPGTCTIRSMPNIMHLAMQKCSLTLEEAFLGVTYNAAKALGLDKEIGLIKKEYNADLILWGLENLSEIPYWFDSSSTKIVKIFKKGKLILG
jgi:imidazolonepropionase